MNMLRTFFQNRRTVLLGVTCILAVYGLTLYKGLSEYKFWMENSQDYVVDGVTAMGTFDAYYWLKMARELDEGQLVKGKADLNKGYPDLVPFAIKGSPSLLARCISFAKKFTGGDYYRAGLLLIGVLAGLFIFPLSFYFYRLGFGAAAISGGLIGFFSHAYYDRIRMGRLDTDLLNVFFPLLASCFILPMHKERGWRGNIGLAMGAGLTMYLFTWWYQQPSFILLYLLVLAAHLLIGKVHWKQTVSILLVFLLFCGPEYVLQSAGSVRTFLAAYVSPHPAGRIIWPNILKIVAEAVNRGPKVTLVKLYGFLPVVFAGFAGLLYLYFRRFKQMVPVTPLLLVGAWALTGPHRFAMYLAPFIGIGVGVLIELMVRYGWEKSGQPKRPLLVSTASVFLMCILFFSTTAYTGFSDHSPPTISAATTKALLDIKRLVPKHSAMFTSAWAFGYPLMEIGDFATYHDGGLQGGIRTTLIDKAVLAPQQKEMVSLLSYLEDYGFNRLNARIRKDNMSAEQMMATVFDYPGQFRGKNVYVLYLEDMIWKFDSIAYFGTWDFNRKKSDPLYYVELHCYSRLNNVMQCSDGTIDLNRGVMNDGAADIPLRAALLVNDGYVVDRQDYGKTKGAPEYYLQVLMKKGKIYTILVADDRLFQTNFNQQFLLGNYDRRYFEEVYNNFPVARVLKVKSEGEANRGTVE